MIAQLKNKPTIDMPTNKKKCYKSLGASVINISMSPTSLKEMHGKLMSGRNWKENIRIQLNLQLHIFICDAFL